MTEPLFQIGPPPGAARQQCQQCPTWARATNDQLRVRGWLIYDGHSQTNRPLHVRVCPECQQKGSR